MKELIKLIKQNILIYYIFKNYNKIIINIFIYL